MAPTGTERKVMMIIQDLGEATKVTISKGMGISSDYVEYICQYLILSGYLKQTKGSYPQRKYSLTEDGKKALAGYAGAVGSQTPFAPGAGYHKFKEA